MSKQEPSEAQSDRKLKIITAVGIVIAVFLFFVFIFGGPKPQQQEQEEAAECVIEGHEYVDLALPSGLKWATTNVGANAIEESGDYFQWGQTEPMTNMDVDNPLNEKDNQWLTDNGYLDDKGNLKLDYDAANQIWGGSWRMPTNDEIEELIQNTTIEWKALNGVYGYVVTSNNNDKSIFLPACGFLNGAKLKDEGKVGYIWTSTPHPDDPSASFCLNYFDAIFYSNFSFRTFGYSVRPVSE